MHYSNRLLNNSRIYCHLKRRQEMRQSTTLAHLELLQNKFTCPYAFTLLLW